MKKVYRIELPKEGLEIGMGPYRIDMHYIESISGDYEGFKDLAHSMAHKHNGDLHPGMLRDFDDKIFENLNINSNKYHCGFSTQELALDWFSGFILGLNKLGYKLVEYTVKNYRVIYGKSGRQLIFTEPSTKVVTNILKECNQIN
jgi:hypothetical protein